MSDINKIWFNGALRPAEECTVSVMSHALHYGSSVFEGIRAYDTPSGSVVFRLTDHIKRLRYSADVYRIPLRYSDEELVEACRETIKANGLTSAYLRPLVMRGNSGLGVIPKDMDAIDVVIIAMKWGAYLGEDGLRNGIRACITSWQRLAPNTIPPGVKAGGNYLSSQLIGWEARDRGCDEGIALGTDGLLSEGAGENIFVVTNGRILTPPGAASILKGITRSTVMTLAAELGLPLVEQAIAREQIYGADEVFMTGTAAEVTPVRQIDHITIGSGGCGPVTRQIQDAFFGLFEGKTEDRWGWLEPL
ncbi:branched-chain-amino-acid transaminase [Elongatibacter sediminis]|uniref:Branched-chain-amino-acid aminotransferase n=1 Tax=Elongatibacter sediminis TaxID=3119006 RepID=A0AAW9R708_9GAMM